MKPSCFLQSKTRRACAIHALALGLLPFCAFANTARIEPGHSAIWGYAGRNSEGWIVEILPDDTAALYWYTFDDAGKPRWITSVAPILHDEDGDRIVFDELLAGRGGRFGTNYPASSVILENVGTAELSFTDCNRGRISFTAYGKTRNLPLSRRTRTMGAGCAPIHGIPGEQIQPYAGTSGTWMDPGKAGQTFTLQWQADGSAVLNWFTFDANGKPFWVSGTGEYEDGRIVFPQMESVQGGRFGAYQPPLAARFDTRRTLRGEQIDPPEPVTRQPWGRVELELTCDHGTATYQATAEGFGSGSFNLLPMTDLAKPACPWVKPKLTDLYDVEYVALPIPPSTRPPSSGYIFAKSISDDGTVIGAGASLARGADVVVLRPGATQWEWLSTDGDHEIWGIFQASDKTIYSHRWFRDDAGYLTTIMVMRWREGTGWQHLENTPAGHDQVLYGISRNGRHLTGEGYPPDSPGSYLWRWDSDIGNVELPVTSEFLGSRGTSISNDGNITIGVAHRVVEGVPFPVPFSVIWRNGQAPQRLLGSEGQDLGRVQRCNADCSIVFGSDWHEFWSSPPESYTPWYLKPSGGFGYLGLPDDAIPELGAGVHEASADGSIAVGEYTRMIGPLNPNAPNPFSVDAFLWTQDTGMVNIGTILEEKFQIPRWRYRYATSVSPDGRLILLTGWDRAVNDPIAIHQAAVLRLKPKVPPGAGIQP